MSYFTALRSQLQTVLVAAAGVGQPLNSYFGSPSSQITLGDYRPLDAGYENVLVLLPGSVGPSRTASYTVERTWDVLLDLAVRFTDEVDTDSRFCALRDALLAVLDAYPTLSGVTSVTYVTIASEGDPDAIVRKTSSDADAYLPVFIVQRLRMTIYTTDAMSGGES